MMETLIYAILIILFIGVILYLLFNSKSQNVEECNIAPEATHELHIDREKLSSNNNNSSDEDSIKPVQVDVPPVGGKDNLQLIKGVGKVLERVLNENGIYQFEQIANWSDAEVAWMDKSISFPGRIERENWRGQSRDLAKGKSTEFSERVERGQVTTSKKS